METDGDFGSESMLILSTIVHVFWKRIWTQQNKQSSTTRNRRGQCSENDEGETIIGHGTKFQQWQNFWRIDFKSR